MSTPPHGVRLTTTTLDANDSPLGALLGDQDKDDDMTSIRSPLSTEPLTRTNSQASMKSLDSGQSVKSVQSQDTNGSTKPAATTAGPSPLSAVRSSHVRKPSVDQVQQPSKPTASAGPTKPVFNPLVDSPARPASATSAQSIEAFQSLSRASSPAISTLPVSKSGFERETDSPVSPPISQSKAPVRVDIMDDAAEAFAKDMLLSPGASESVSTSTLGSSSFLDSGLATSQSMASFSADVFSKPDPISTSMTATVSTTSTTTTSHDVGTPALKSGSKPTGGFSLGVDMADPWTTNSFADSLEHTTLSTTRIDYTQSSHSSNLASESMFSLPPSSSSSFSATTTTTTTTTMPPTPAPPKTVAPKRPMTPVTIPSLEDDIGGFGDVISPLRSNNTPSLSVPPSLTAELSRQRSPSPMVLGLSSSSTSTWNILDAVEAATLDPDFQGPTSLMNQSTDKVLAIMQMPRDALDKDVSAMEVFDNPWE
ncbi:hypothetical protein BGX31_003482 [Mortierella sp. GBA43]|nr:hypothetical protein BGX31_003482 [Mortierella sp. GBA43]